MSVATNPDTFAPTATNDESRPKTVTIIVPVLNEMENVDRLCERLKLLQTSHPTYGFEFLVVDDGSTDGTADAILERVDPSLSVRLITLSRNYGSHAACTAGFDASTGDAVIMIGADLQEPPELITRFLERWEAGADVVWGVRARRAIDRGLGTALSIGFSRLFNRYSELKTYPAEGPSGVLCTRPVVEALRRLTERHRNVYGLIAWLGFPSDVVEYEQHGRQAGHSKWTTSKLAKLAIDSFVEFSFAPVRLVTYCGIGSAFVGFVYALFLIVQAFVSDTAPVGWTTVIVVVLILGGLQLVMLGVLGEYIWRGTDETRRRPLYIIQKERRAGGAPATISRAPSDVEPPGQIA